VWLGKEDVGKVSPDCQLKGNIEWPDCQLRDLPQGRISADSIQTHLLIYLLVYLNMSLFSSPSLTPPGNSKESP
jgi:hypothetical protein